MLQQAKLTIQVSVFKDNNAGGSNNGLENFGLNIRYFVQLKLAVIIVEKISP